MPILFAPLQRLVLLRVLRHVTHLTPPAPTGEQEAEEEEMLAYLAVLRRAAREGHVSPSAPAAERRGDSAAGDVGGLGGELVVAWEEVEALQRWASLLYHAFQYYPGPHAGATRAANGHEIQSVDVCDLLPPGLTILRQEERQTVGGVAEGHAHTQWSTSGGNLTRLTMLTSLASACHVAQLVCPPVSACLCQHICASCVCISRRRRWHELHVHAFLCAFLCLCTHAQFVCAHEDGGKILWR